jgi:NADPH:quinone reductase-like Zn-dependent oxidoreductase
VPIAAGRRTTTGPPREKESLMQALVPAGRAAGLVTMAEVPRPEPRPDEALVRVQAFSVNRGEIFRLENPEPGSRPGKDVAGVVVRAAADGTGRPRASASWATRRPAAGLSTPRSRRGPSRCCRRR